jgi:hypothetical protein
MLGLRTTIFKVSNLQKPNNVGGEIMVASIKDPWNNVIGIIYNPEFKLPE